VREVVWDRRPFLVEEGGEEDKGGKRVGYSPWKRVGIVGIAVLADTEAGTEAGIAAGTVALGGIEADTSALKGIAAGTALVRES
jgi:hypothetical protein